MNDDKTAAQCVAICRLCMALDIRELLESRPMSKGEAGRLIREMASQARAKRMRYGTSHYSVIKR